MDSNELKAEAMIRGPRLAETGGVVGTPIATALTGVRMPGYKAGCVWKVTREEVVGWLDAGDAGERDERKGDPS